MNVKTALAELMAQSQYSLPQAEKERLLLASLNELTAHHHKHCSAYARLLSVLQPDNKPAQSLAGIPYLPVSLFKSHRLVSVPEAEVFKTMTSSGTTGQEVSQIVLDRETAARQTSALAQIMQHVLGTQRLPMILIDSPTVIKERKQFSARGAGVLGMMSFGRQHFYALDQDMNLDVAGLQSFLQKFGREPFLLFGFTFMVWQYFYQQIQGLGLDLSHGTLIHSGGWKKLQEQAISNQEFKQRFHAATGLQRIYNFYGMVEQVGSVFLEGEDGFLYAPNFADVIIRDPHTWQEAALGQVGVVQVLSALPLSYPGHSILTEDLGVVHGVDDSTCERRGKYFSILGRVPKTELRGCSDTHAYSKSVVA